MTDISREAVDGTTFALRHLHPDDVDLTNAANQLDALLDAAEGRVTVKPLAWIAGFAEEGHCWRAENPAQPGLRYVAFTPADKEEWDAKHAAAILSAITAPSDKIAEAADMDVFGARRVIDAYDMANPMRTADMHPAACHCHRCAIDWLRALAGKGE